MELYAAEAWVGANAIHARKPIAGNFNVRVVNLPKLWRSSDFRRRPTRIFRSHKALGSQESIVEPNLLVYVCARGLKLEIEFEPLSTVARWLQLLGGNCCKLF
jgi:hypothetical protein